MLAKEPPTLDRADHVIIVAYHLPLRVERAGDGYNIQWDDERGIDMSGMGLPTRITYVGCIELDVPDQMEQDRLERLLLQQYNSVVLFLDADLKERYYHRFCRQYLAPMMHNQMHVIQSTDPFQPDEWRAYCQVNQLFADKVLENYGNDGEGNEMIWVHDYHLMLAPSCIVRKMPLAKIGFFLHAPFPASDVWRTVAVRLELLRSLLNVDLVGFLLFEYARNFLTCCKRMLGLEYEFQKGGFLGVEYEGRHVHVQICTFGISPKQVDRWLKAPEFVVTPNAADVALFDVCSRPHRMPGHVLVGGLDYLDRLKGVAAKLLAWEALLRDYPHYRQGYTLVQVCVGARNRIALNTAPAVEAELRGIVARINATFPGSVHFEVRSHLTPIERLRLWCACSVLLVTALREAINVFPLEYVLARQLSMQPPGVLVLSEFTGFARVLNGCLRINPNSQTELVETLDTALQMQIEERAARAAKDFEHIMRCTNEAFAQRFLRELKATAAKTEGDFVRVGFGHAKFRLVGMGAGFKPLDSSSTIEAFQRASRRLLLLDWGGTLAPSVKAFYDQRDATGYALPRPVLDALAALSAHPSCDVMIMSGLSKDKVEAAFGAVPGLSLAVEHGFEYRLRSGEWRQPLKADDQWRSIAHSVMSMYATRTHGAFVQQKGSSILYDFTDSDPEFGAMSSKELQMSLQHVLADFPVVVRKGKGYVEACHKDINKGAMASLMLDLLEADGGGKVDFILCAGDDSTDELMFSALHAKRGKTDAGVFTVTVGRKPSEAERYLDDYREVVSLLELLCSIGFRAPGMALGTAGSESSGAGGGGMGRKMKAGLGSMSASYGNLAELG